MKTWHPTGYRKEMSTPPPPQWRRGKSGAGHPLLSPGCRGAQSIHGLQGSGRLLLQLFAPASKASSMQLPLRRLSGFPPLPPRPVSASSPPPSTLVRGVCPQEVAARNKSPVSTRIDGSLYHLCQHARKQHALPRRLMQRVGQDSWEESPSGTRASSGTATTRLAEPPPGELVVSRDCGCPQLDHPQ